MATSRIRRYLASVASSGSKIRMPSAPSTITVSPVDTSERNGPRPTTAGISIAFGHDGRVAGLAAVFGRETKTLLRSSVAVSLA